MTDANPASPPLSTAAGDFESNLPSPFGKFQLLRVLGTGACGSVYLAQDTVLERTVALKVLDTSGNRRRQDRDRFLLEARSAAQLNHPQIVAVYDVDEVERMPYIAMEWMQGGSAQQAIDNRGPIPWREATAWMLDACQAVASVHQAGMLHRDIKPGNLLLTRQGRAKLGDFGLVKLTHAGGLDTSLVGKPLGTPSFMSPEQCRAEPLDECTDIYSLGATYYALLSGRAPFQSDSPLGVMFAHCSSPPPRLDSLDGEIPTTCDEIIGRAMAKNPAHRFPHAEALAAALHGVLDGNGERLGVLPVAPPARRKQAVAGSLFAAAMAAVAVASLGVPMWRAGSVGRPGPPSDRLTTANPASDKAANPGGAVLPGGAASANSAAATVSAAVSQAASAGELAERFPALAVLGKHRGRLTDLEFDSGGHAIIAVGSGGALAIWNIEAQQSPIRRFVENEPPRSKLLALGYFPQLNLALTGGNASELVLWNLATGQIVARAPQPHGSVRSIDVAADGKTFLTGGDTGWNLWELSDDRKLIDQGPISAGLVLVHTVRHSAAQGTVAATSGNGVVTVRSLKFPGSSKRIDTDDQVFAFAFAHTRCEFAYATRRGRVVLGATTSRITRTTVLAQGDLAPLVMEFSPNRRLLAIGEESGRVTLFDIDSGRRHPFSIGSRNAITALRFSTHGDQLALGTSTGEVLLARLPLDRFSPPTPRTELLLDKAANYLSDAKRPSRPMGPKRLPAAKKAAPLAEIAGEDEQVEPVETP